MGIRVDGRGHRGAAPQWRPAPLGVVEHDGGTSPVVAGNLLYVGGRRRRQRLRPTSGRRVAQLPSGDVHWQSPIVADGRVAVAEGNANDHVTTGVLDIYSALPARSV